MCCNSAKHDDSTFSQICNQNETKAPSEQQTASAAPRKQALIGALEEESGLLLLSNAAFH